MFKANNMRVLMVVSVALFVLCSSVNMFPARYFLDEIKKYSKRQGNQQDVEFCLEAKMPCYILFDPNEHHCYAPCSRKIE